MTLTNRHCVTIFALKSFALQKFGLKKFELKKVIAHGFYLLP